MDTPKRPPIIIAIANQKGGVGKTTVAINLGAELQRLGRNVAILDLDQQAHATLALGIDPLTVRNHIGHLLLDDTLAFADVLVPTPYGMQLVPSHIDLAAQERELDRKINRERVLARRLTALPADLDVVLLDCPPSLSLLTLNALTAAQWVLVPLQTEPFAVAGFSALLNTIKEVQQETNPQLQLLGVLLTLFDPDHAVARDIQTQMRATLKNRVLTTVIPDYKRLAEAALAGPIRSYAPRHRATQVFEELAQEVLDRATT